MSETTKPLQAGMTISIGRKLYKVESSVKVTVPKGAPFLKAKLKDVQTGKIIEKNFKPDQPITDVSLQERKLEYLYMEGKDYLFIDIGNLEQVLVPASVIGDRTNYLKEGVDVRASFYGDTIFSVELPQFLELMIADVDTVKGKKKGEQIRLGTLETGATMEVPPFIEAGDIVKVDTKTGDYIQRV
ncbi:MAG: elongation factor P [Chlamydiia bacterium]|nr:elongation factor P [Chlamydiia bacterium]